MSHCLILLDDRLVILGIFGAEIFIISIPANIFATLIQKEFCQLQIFFFAGDAIQFGQSDFNFLMSRWIMFFAGTKNRIDQISIF